MKGRLMSSGIMNGFLMANQSVISVAAILLNNMKKWATVSLCDAKQLPHRLITVSVQWSSQCILQVHIPTQNDVLRPALKCVLLTLLSLNPDWRWFHRVRIDKYTCKSLVCVTGGTLYLLSCARVMFDSLFYLLTYTYTQQYRRDEPASVSSDAGDWLIIRTQCSVRVQWLIREDGRYILPALHARRLHLLTLS